MSAGIDNDERLEQEAAMTHYREFMRWFSRNYGLLIDDAWTSATYLFKCRLISFGATVTNYFARKHATTQRQDRMQSITPATVAKKFCRHIEKCYLDVLPAFDKLLTESSSFLCYIGPPIRIIPKTEIRLFQEKLCGYTMIILVPRSTFLLIPFLIQLHFLTQLHSRGLMSQLQGHPRHPRKRW
jgi:hypothetical protein